MKSFVALSLISLVTLALGCETKFYGAPTVPGGRRTCEQQCASYGMVLAGMVSMGENYSDGCICAVPTTPVQPTAMVSAAAPAIAGVAVQQQEAAQQQQNNHR